MVKSLEGDDLHGDIATALNEVLSDPAVAPDLRTKLETVIVNCLIGRFADSDVRAVIDAVAARNREADNGA